MDVVGEQFSRNEIFLPEMMIAARAMNIGLEYSSAHAHRERGIKQRQGGHRDGER